MKRALIVFLALLVCGLSYAVGWAFYFEHWSVFGSSVSAFVAFGALCLTAATPDQ